MRKVLIVIGTVATALALAGVASAATPQGKLTGGAVLTANPLGIHSITVKTTIVDGETQYVGLSNDRSHDCDGDSGTIKVTYGGYHSNSAESTTTDGGSGGSYGYYYNIICAHYTGNGAMQFDYYDTKLHEYVIFRIKDRVSGDQVLYQTATDATNAMNWVNIGTGNSGNGATQLIETPICGDFTVTP